MFDNGVSLEEVKEAFNVFDENKDGCIDCWVKEGLVLFGIEERICGMSKND
jgi:hypothetical protein